MPDAVPRPALGGSQPHPAADGRPLGRDDRQAAGHGPPAVVAVDWGTSSLRIWLLDAAGAVLAEQRSAEGLAAVADRGFEAVLRDRLAALDPALAGAPRPLKVVLCGMVGARQGWREAPYVDLPARLATLADQAVAVDAAGLDARILPGLARRSPSRPDVLRGEETQLLGLTLDDPGLHGVVCLPGTHCKWVTLDGGTVADFSTAMTGELFALLAAHSILRHSIGAAHPSGNPASPAFRNGLDLGLADPAMVGARLFSIRADGLLNGTGGGEAADRLSGLLIGAEVGSALAVLAPTEPVVLVAAGRLGALYGEAIHLAGHRVRTVDADQAVRAGLLHAARRLWPAGHPPSPGSHVP